jgi:hypothetical protein
VGLETASPEFAVNRKKLARVRETVRARRGFIKIKFSRGVCLGGS